MYPHQENYPRHLQYIIQTFLFLTTLSLHVTNLQSFHLKPPVRTYRHNTPQVPTRYNPRIPPLASNTNLGDDDGDSPSTTGPPLPSKIDKSRLDVSIDSFLSLPSSSSSSHDIDDDDTGPTPSKEPGETIDVALRALRELGDRDGARALLRFCTPLKRRERWGGGIVTDAWKEILRGAITPSMLSRRIRASPFAGLLDWTKLSVTEGSVSASSGGVSVGGPSVAYVNAAMFFEEGVEPMIITFTLRKVDGVWLIDTAVVSEREWFIGDYGQ